MKNQELNSLQGSEIFITAIEDCSRSSKGKIASIARQLFVGLDELKIKSQQEINLGQKSFVKSLANSRVDSKEILVASYTSQHGDCVRDYVLWAPKGSKETGSKDFFMEELVKFEKHIKQLS